MTRYHAYFCKTCKLKFAVDQDFEDQSVVNCPVCKTDENLEDAGQAVEV